MDKIYLDNAATTKPAEEVIRLMSETNQDFWGNPSSVHSFGQAAHQVLDDGRRFTSFFVGCKPEEIIFTSGGSEANNLAIRGVVGSVISNPFDKLRVNSEKSHGILKQVQNDKVGIQKDNNTIPHIITSATEHHSVLHTIQDLEKQGLVEATYLKPDNEGIISPKQVIDSVKENTILVSLIYVNNETGVVTPIREIGQALQKIKQAQKIYFHTDAVQAAEFFQLSPEYLGVDLLSFTAHKIHGPRGIGVLFVKKGVPLKAQITGGDQEYRLRAGTENIAGIAGLSKAIDLILHERGDSGAMNQSKDLPELMTGKQAQRLTSLRDRLVNGLMKEISNSIYNGSVVRHAPHIANISFLNAEGEAIILNLDFLGIAVSSGSACTSRSLDPSHVLSAMGIPPEKAHGSIRFSLSRETTEKEIDRVLEVVPGIIKKLREMSPFS
jgi:cysteine desulfurase